MTKDIQSKVDGFDKLVDLMKEKLKSSNRHQKIQILTLTPDSWSLRKASQEFNVSKSTITKARKMRNDKGILEIPDQIN
jgi:transposase